MIILISIANKTNKTKKEKDNWFLFDIEQIDFVCF